MKEYRIAWKTPGCIKSASFRYRALLPCKYLQQAGWSCEIFDYQNLDKYKIVIFQKIYDEPSLNLVKTLKSKGIITVFDLCDNHFYYQLDDLSALAKRQEKLQTMLDLVDVISVSTPELKKLIAAKTSKLPVVIDDAIEIPPINPLAQGYFKLKKILRNRANNSLNIVWYGNAGSKNPPYGMVDLARILPALEKINQEIPIKLTIISNSESTFKELFSSVNFTVKYYQWKLWSFPYLFSDNDICLIPINLNPHTRYKTNNRLVLSLLLDVAVIADKIPSYQEFDRFILFSDWEANLQKYAFDPKLRQQHIEEGQAYIISQYNRDRVVDQWSSLFQQLLA